MALERVPADIRAAGGVARMADPRKIREIKDRVSIPVMAKCRIGHTAEARILEALEVDMIDESEVLTPADPFHHVDKKAFTVPFVCGARNLGEALRRIDGGRRDDPHRRERRARATSSRRSATFTRSSDEIAELVAPVQGRPRGLGQEGAGLRGDRARDPLARPPAGRQLRGRAGSRPRRTRRSAESSASTGSSSAAGFSRPSTR